MMRTALLSLFTSLLIVSRAHTEDATVVRDAIVARHEMLQNIEVAYRLEEMYSPAGDVIRPVTLSDGGILTMLEGSFSWDCKFRYAAAKAFYGRSPREGNAEPYQSMAYAATRSEMRHGNTGLISASSPLPSKTVIDVALGLRVKQEWIEPSMWKTAELQHNGDGTVTLTWRPPLTNQVVRQHRWVFDAALGYALVRYDLQYQKPGAVHLVTDTEVINGDLRPSPGYGIVLPHDIQLRNYYTAKGKNPIVTVNKRLSVTQYTLGELDDTDEDFFTVWGEGNVVLDNRADRTVVVRDRPQTLNDRVLQQYYSGTFGGVVGEASSQRAIVIVIANLVVILAVVFMYRRYAATPKQR